MGIDPESVRLQKADDTGQKILIEENTARQNHGQTTGIEGPALFQRHTAQGVHKPAGHSGGGEARREIGAEGTDQRTGVKTAQAVLLVEPDRICPARDAVIRQSLQQGGRLAVIGGGLPA